MLSLVLHLKVITITRQITSPLVAIEKALRSIGGGDFAITVPSSPINELHNTANVVMEISTQLQVLNFEELWLTFLEHAR